MYTRKSTNYLLRFILLTAAWMPCYIASTITSNDRQQSREAFDEQCTINWHRETDKLEIFKKPATVERLSITVCGVVCILASILLFIQRNFFYKKGYLSFTPKGLVLPSGRIIPWSSIDYENIHTTYIKEVEHVLIPLHEKHPPTWWERLITWSKDKLVAIPESWADPSIEGSLKEMIKAYLENDFDALKKASNEALRDHVVFNPKTKTLTFYGGIIPMILSSFIFVISSLFIYFVNKPSLLLAIDTNSHIYLPKEDLPIPIENVTIEDEYVLIQQSDHTTSYHYGLEIAYVNGHGEAKSSSLEPWDLKHASNFMSIVQNIALLDQLRQITQEQSLVYPFDEQSLAKWHKSKSKQVHTDRNPHLSGEEMSKLNSQKDFLESLTGTNLNLDLTQGLDQHQLASAKLSYIASLFSHNQRQAFEKFENLGFDQTPSQESEEDISTDTSSEQDSTEKNTQPLPMTNISIPSRSR